MVGAGGWPDCSGLECLLLGFGMRRPGTYIRVLTAYILTKNSRLGFARAWEGAGVVGGVGALAPGTHEITLILLTNVALAARVA